MQYEFQMDTCEIDHFEEAEADIPVGARFWQYARNPRNLGTCAHSSASATGVGSCGDKVRVDLHIEDNRLVEVKFNPNGCVYTLACASAMSVMAQGRTIDEALQLQPEDVARELEVLPDDHMHCARLAVNTLGEAVSAFYGNPPEGDNFSNSSADYKGE